MADLPLSLELLRVLKTQLPDMLRVLRRFVTSESPSLEKAAADRCCTVVAKEWRKHGVRVERISQKHRGDHLRMTRPRNAIGDDADRAVLPKLGDVSLTP